MMNRNSFRHGLTILALVVPSLAVRLPGLGSWCLTFDEFYIWRSVSFIRSGLLPEFPGGGFYTRGLLLQYLTALVSTVMDDPEFLVRFIPMVAGVATVPVFYFLSRRILCRSLAVAGTLAMMVSSWQIEFSRFGRMYSLYQLLFLLLVYCAVRGFVDGSARHRRILWICAFASPLVHEACIFLPPLLLALLLLRESSGSLKPGKHLVLIAFLTGGVLVLNLVDYRYLGIVHHLPESFSAAGSRLPLALPELDLVGRVAGVPAALAALGVLAALGLLAAWFSPRQGLTERALNGLIVLALALHQVGLALWVVVLASLYHPRFGSGLRRSSWIWKASVLCMLAFWSVAGILNGDLWAAGGTLRAALRGIADTFFFYPDVYASFLLPFVRVVPVFFLLVLAGTAIAVVRYLWKRPDPGTMTVVVLAVPCIFLLSMIHTLYYETRYSYFFFPLLIVIGLSQVEAFCGFLKRFVRNAPRGRLEAIFAMVVLAVFVLTEDFHFRHVTHVAARDINFRMGTYERFQRHWYPRMDVKEPSRFVNESFREGDRVVIDLIPCSMYLDVPFTVYNSERAGSFPGISRERGTRELWTGGDLIRKAGDLADHVPGDVGSRLWLITMKGDRGPHSLKRQDRPELLAGRHGLDATLQFLGEDDRVQVWSLKAATTAVAVVPSEGPGA